MTLRRAFIWFAITYVFAAGGYFVSQALASRILGVGSYGTFATATTVAVLVGQLGSLGLQRSGLRSAARQTMFDPLENVEVRQAARTVATTALPVIAIVTGLVVTVVVVNMSIVIATASLAVLTYGLAYTTLVAGFLRGNGAVKGASLLDGRSGGALMAVSQVIAIVIVRLEHPGRLGIGAVLLTVGLGSLPATAYAAVRYLTLWDVKVPAVSVRRGLQLAKELGGFFAGIQAAGVINTQVETWVATMILSGTAASQIAAGQRISLLVVLPLTASQTVSAPAFARLHASADTDSMRDLLRATSTYSLAVAALLTLPLLIVPGWLLSHTFGTGFGGGANLLRILLIGPLAMAAFGQSSMALSMAGHERVVWRIQAVTAVVRVVVGIAAAYLFGATGLAIAASTVSVVSWAVMGSTARSRLSVRRILTLRPSLRVLALIPAG